MVAENVFSTVVAASLISILLNVFIVRGASALLEPRLTNAVDESGNRLLMSVRDSVAVEGGPEKLVHPRDLGGYSDASSLCR